MKKILAGFLAAFAVMLSVLSCGLQGGISGTVTVTNQVVPVVYFTNTQVVIDWGIQTNWSVITNPVCLTGDNYIIQGNIYITNAQNEDTVQPTFFLAGTMDGDLVNTVPDGQNSLVVYVTNSGFSTNGRVYTEGGVKHWEAAVFSQNAYPYIHLKVETLLEGFGRYFMSMNFHLSNIPALAWDGDYDGYLTNSETMTLSGESWVVNPDNIQNIYLYRVMGGVTNSAGVPAYSAGTAWTNTVNSRGFSFTDVTLGNGQNLFYGYAVSSQNISNAITPFTITRALIGVDGVYDAAWSSAPIVGTSSTTAYNGYGLTSLRMTNDEASLYFWLEVDSLPAITESYNGPHIALALDAGISGGSTNDPWGGKWTYTMTNLPDFCVEFRIQSGGGQALYGSESVTNWSVMANNWGLGLNGVSMAVDTNAGFEISIPMSLLGLSTGDTVQALAVLSGFDGTAGNSQAWDIVPSASANTLVTNENDFDTETGVYAAPYTIQ